MKMNSTMMGMLGLALVGSADPCVAQMKKPPGVQGLIGATVIDEDEMVYDEVNGLDPAAAESGGVETLVTLGGVGQQPFTTYAPNSRAGIEYGFLFSYGADDRNVTAGSGVAVISIDSSLMLGDAFTGVFVSQSIGGSSRLYAGAGPLLMWGRVKGDFVERPIESGTEVTLDESDSAFGFGGYVRAGIEVEWPSGGTFGIGARGFTSRLDFDDTLGDADIEGVQGFVTLTQGF